MITLSDKSDAEVRYMIFERLNTGSENLKQMETRKGAYGGPFIDFVYDKCSEHPLFLKHTSFTERVRKRGEAQELIIRFFALSDNYTNFKRMNLFLNNYTKKMNKDFDKRRMWNEFDKMLKFVDNNLPTGFTKGKGSQKTPRVKFEAIAVGINLALRIKPALKVENMSFLNSKLFIALVTGGSHNTPTNVKSKIEYVRDQLLK